MKILCSEHYGPIEIADKDVINALKNPLQTTMLVCPVCDAQIFIHDVWMENALIIPMKKQQVVYRKSAK